MNLAYVFRDLFRARRHAFVAVLAAAFVGTLAAPPLLLDAEAKTEQADKDDDEDEKPEFDPTKPAPVKRTPRFKPRGLKWGQGHAKVYEVYARAIDRDYVARYKEVEPGVQTERLEDEIREKKHAFRMSHLAFKTPPSTLDGTAFEGEYTYGNREAMMRIRRKGRERTLFFIRDKLWKTIDVYPLKKGGKFGEDFASAVAYVEKVLKQEGRKIYADEDEEKLREVDWADGKVHFRLIDFGAKEVAIAYVDMATEAKLSRLRESAEEKKKKAEKKPDYLR
ncbi:MAG: hypothetical protein AAGN82_25000 [Myxococcota bacterium]